MKPRHKVILALLLLPLAAQAQDYGAMLQQSIAAMNANIERGQ